MNPEILKKLKNVRPTAAGWQATCPAHDDRKASLSIAVGETGNTVIHCQAGCSVESVISAMGETMKILFNDLPQAPAARKRIAATYDYKDASGKLIFQAVRFEPKSFSQRRPDPDKPGAWLWNLKGVDLVLYRLPELLATPKTDPVFICEGEKDVDSLRALGVTATCNPMGAGKWRAWFNNTLAGREVFIIPDRDSAAKKFAGQKHAADVRDALTGKASRVRVLELPGENVKDASDWIAAGGTVEELLALASACRAAPEWVEPDYSQVSQTSTAPESTESTDKPVKKRATQNEADRLGDLAISMIDLWTNGERVYATVPTALAKANFLVDSPSFRHWITALGHKHFGKIISESTSRKIADGIVARARFEGSPARHEKLFLRVGHTEEAVYLDLCNDAWECVEITSDGWRIISDPPVKFRRSRSMIELPKPEPGGSIDELRPLINAHQESVWRLCVSWLIGSLHPTGPYPILILQGEQGTAKSTMSRLLRELIDPSLAAIRCVPKDDDDILIAANNGWVMAYDNLSGIPDRLSDVFCRMATGGGFAKRELYTDQEEVVSQAKRPQILNGIDDVAHRADLRDRALIINLEPIPKDMRREEQEIISEFESARPRILGALLSAVSCAIKNRKTHKIPGEVPRMADFAHWVNAAEGLLPWSFGEFISTYREAAATAVETALEGSPLARALVEFAKEKKYWGGLVSDLLEELNAIAPETAKKARAWPLDSIRLSGKIRRIAPELRGIGVSVEFVRQKQGMYGKITYSETPDSMPFLSTPIGDTCFNAGSRNSGVDENSSTPLSTPNQSLLWSGFPAKGVDGVDNSLSLEKKEKKEEKKGENGEKEEKTVKEKNRGILSTPTAHLHYPGVDQRFQGVDEGVDKKMGSTPTNQSKGFLI